MDRQLRPTRVIIVQHGEKIAEPGDPGLTDRGRRQALAVSRTLASAGIERIIASPLTRARETAEIIGAALDLGVTTDRRLRERMNWDGPGSQLLGSFLDDWARATRDRDARPRYGDSSRVSGERMLLAVMDAGAGGGGDPVACVSHGGATVDLLRTVLGDAELDRVRPGLISEGIPGGALTEFSVGDRHLAVVAVATIDHLAPSDRTGHRTT